jgi:sugar lactone lactonase YvrE
MTYLITSNKSFFVDMATQRATIMKTDLITHRPCLITSTAALLLAFVATPVRADILYVANADNPHGANYIVRMPSGGTGPWFADSSSGLSTPLGLAFDASANLFVANNGSGTIMKFTPDAVGSVFATGLSGPSGLAFDRAGNLFVNASGSIMKFTPEGVGSVFASGVGAIGLAFDSGGNLYAANNGGGTIIKFTPDGSSSVLVSGLSAPEGLAFDHAGNLFVAEIGNRTISKITPEGGRSLFASSGLVNPVGLAFDSAGALYVGDGNGIKMFTPDGVGSVFAPAPFVNGWPSFLAFTDDAGVPLPLANQIPEPSLWGLVGLGLALLLGVRFQPHNEANRVPRG